MEWLIVLGTPYGGHATHGHKDQTNYVNGFIELAEYGHARCRMTVQEDGTLVQHFGRSESIGKRWKRIDFQPRTNLLRSLTGPSEYGKIFFTTLPNGVTVELLGVCEHPSQGNHVFNLYSDKIWGGFVLSEGKKMLNQSIGIAQGPWKTIAEANPMHTQSFGDIAFGKAFESDFEGIGVAAGVTVTYTIDKEKVDYRVIAVDQKNSIHTSSRRSGIGNSSWMQTTVHFKDLQIDEIKEFQFQTRPYEWFEFKNVSLQPGFKTDVQVEVEKH